MKFTEAQLESGRTERGANDELLMMSDELKTAPASDSTPNPGGEFLLYTTDDGKARVECVLARRPDASKSVTPALSKGYASQRDDLIDKGMLAPSDND
jgi:hypothetical protein